MLAKELKVTLPITSSQLMLEMLLVSTWFIGVMAVQFLLPQLPTIMDELQINATLAKYTISIFLLGKALGMLGFGPLSEKYGRKRFMLIGLLLYTTSSLAAYFANHIIVLLFLRFTQGLGTSATVLMGRTMINDCYKENKAAVVFSHVFLAASVVITLLPLIASFIAIHFYWRMIFIFMASYTIFIWLLCYIFLPETHVGYQQNSFNFKNLLSYYRPILSHPTFLGYVFCSIFMIAGESAFNTASSFLLIKTLGVSTHSFGWWMTMLAVGHLVGTLLCGQLVKRFNLVSMMGTGVVILAVSSFTMAGLTMLGFNDLLIVMVPMIIFYIGTGFIMTITAVGAVVPFPNLIGLSMSTSLLLNYSFSAFSSFAMSHLSTASAKPVSLLIAIFSLLAFFAWYFCIYQRVHKT